MANGFYVRPDGNKLVTAYIPNPPVPTIIGTQKKKKKNKKAPNDPFFSAQSRSTGLRLLVDYQSAETVTLHGIDTPFLIARGYIKYISNAQFYNKNNVR